MLTNHSLPTESTHCCGIIVFDGQQGFPTAFNITVSRLNRELAEIYQRLPYLVWIGVLLALSVLLVRELRKGKARSKRNTKHRLLKRARLSFLHDR